MESGRKEYTSEMDRNRFGFYGSSTCTTPIHTNVYIAHAHTFVAFKVIQIEPVRTVTYTSDGYANEIYSQNTSATHTHTQTPNPNIYIHKNLSAGVAAAAAAAAHTSHNVNIQWIYNHIFHATYCVPYILRLWWFVSLNIYWFTFNARTTVIMSFFPFLSPRLISAVDFASATNIHTYRRTLT